MCCLIAADASVEDCIEEEEEFECAGGSSDVVEEMDGVDGMDGIDVLDGVAVLDGVDGVDGVDVAVFVATSRVALTIAEVDVGKD